ncbi:DUF4136 domain-containing protein [Thalassotalea sp. PLHSN55]|uniref:DUF4136 domain-containing protein n=1 Tax=Thalassotalea sp. PLHSN55 TaxID=3435888 RepID=UPI003F828D50
MNNTVKFIAAIATAISLSACVNVTPEPQHNRNNQVAISSVRDLPISYPAGSTFSLSPKYLKHVSFKPEQVKHIYDIYTQAIVNSLVEQGYVQAENSETAQFYVGFGLALDEDLESSNVSEFFGVSPGLHAVEDMDKGSFLVFIEDTQTTSTVWRGAVQGYVQTHYSAEERMDRAQKVVDKVMLQFYTKL